MGPPKSYALSTNFGRKDIHEYPTSPFNILCVLRYLLFESLRKNVDHVNEEFATDPGIRRRFYTHPFRIHHHTGSRRNFQIISRFYIDPCPWALVGLLINASRGPGFKTKNSWEFQNVHPWEEGS